MATADVVMYTSSLFSTPTIEDAAKVRVTFFQSEKPLVVSSPEPDESFPGEDQLDFNAASDPMAAAVQSPPLSDGHPAFHRQGSTDSGWDNPFRPDGDLSREADEIVELIKGGKPITPNSGSVGNSFNLSHEDQADSSNLTQTEVASPLLKANNSNSSPVKSPGKKGTGANGSAAPTDALEVQHTRIGAAGDASQVEHVVLKKKPRCKCCVIQ